MSDCLQTKFKNFVEKGEHDVVLKYTRRQQKALRKQLYYSEQWYRHQEKKVETNKIEKRYCIRCKKKKFSEAKMCRNRGIVYQCRIRVVCDSPLSGDGFTLLPTYQGKVRPLFEQRKKKSEIQPQLLMIYREKNGKYLPHTRSSLVGKWSPDNSVGLYQGC